MAATGDRPHGALRRLIWPVLAAVFLAALGLAYYATRDAGEPQLEADRASPVASGQPAETPSAVEEVVVPSFDIVRLSRSGSGVIAGRAAPGAQIALYAGEREIANAVADGRGEWVIILDQPLPPGATEFSVSAVGRDGKTLISSDIVVVAVPEPTATDVGEGVVAVLTPRDGVGPSRALQLPSGVGLGEPSAALRIEAVDVSTAGAIIAAGRADAGQEVRLYLDDEYRGAVAADESGRWSLDIGGVEAPADPGQEFSLRVDQVVGEGKVVLRVEQSFSLAKGLGGGAGTREVLIQPGSNLWTIARLIYGSGWRYTLIFRANVSQIRDPDLIYPGQLFRLPEQEGTQ